MNFFKKILRILNPSPTAGGLAVSSSHLHFILIGDNNKIKQFSLRLPPGIIEKGRIKDKPNFQRALKNLHSQISARSRHIQAVLNLPADMVHTQAFLMPPLDKSRFNEAARLNLEMISPIDFKNVYASSQLIGESYENSQLELLAAFAEKEAVDGFLEAFSEAGFSIKAVEFPALSLARLVKKGPGFKASESYLVIDITDDGVTLMILKNLELYYSHFHDWTFVLESTGRKDISFENLKTFLAQELKKLINFYSGRKGTIARVILLSATMKKEIGAAIENSLGLQFDEFSPEGFPGLNESWLPALGSALRGLIHRREDSFITLTSETVAVEYEEAKILNFGSWWRKIVFTVLGFIFLTALALNLFLMRQEKDIQAALKGESSKDIEQLKLLEMSAKEFNLLVSIADNAKQFQINWSKFFETLLALSGKNVTLGKISVNQAGVSLSGTAVNEAAVLLFKDRLASQANVSDVSLPLANIKIGPNESASFSLTFKLKSLKF